MSQDNARVIPAHIAAYLKQPAAVPIEPGIQNYDWGNPEFIPEHFGYDNTARRPYAEVWMGAHPELPALVQLDEPVSLRTLIDAAAETLLGTACAEKFGELPFLFKVLSAAQPLSIQVHPNRIQAAAGFARENAAGIPIDAAHRNYKDGNHKVEMAVAITDMYALAGLRPVSEIAANLQAFAASAKFPDDLPAADSSPSAVRELFTAFMSLPQPVVNDILNPVIATLDKKRDTFSRDDWQYWLLRADAVFAQNDDRDRGLFAIPFLQLIHLQPLQALYMPPGITHTYLEGTAVEIMANSNNVLRSGLTPKHIDADELARVIDFAADDPTILAAVAAGDWSVYETSADEFQLSHRPLTGGETVSHTAATSAEILLVLTTDAHTEVTADCGARNFSRHGSTAVFLPVNAACAITTSADARLFRAAVGATSHPDFRTRQPRTLSFGTSGLRGLITDITDLEAYINCRGFLRYLQVIGDAAAGTTVSTGGDMRPSTERILGAVAGAIADEGMQAQYLGRVPTPALTYHGIQHQQPSVMVTGSHIPFDRNGIKFNKSNGEILKSDEAGILAAVAAIRDETYACPADASQFDDDGMFREPTKGLIADPEGIERYTQRYLDFMPPDCLRGMRVVFYQHSAVGRDLLVDLLRALGADVIPMGRSESFVAIDTEDITVDRLQTLQELADTAAAEHGPVDAVISTDGDSDRPLMTGIDADGKVVFYSGDVLGVVVADYLHADSISVPISVNDLVDLHFRAQDIEPLKTKIGSPFVVAGMDQATGTARVGWEANGGFLTGSVIERHGRLLPALPTRDAGLPLLATLHAAVEARVPVTELFARLPHRFSKAGLLDNFDPAISRALLQRLSPPATDVPGALAPFFTPADGFGAITELNYIDGVRIFFDNGDIAHVRPSGNAPQLRMYVCADTSERADEIIRLAVAEPNGILRQLETWIRESSDD